MAARKKAAAKSQPARKKTARQKTAALTRMSASAKKFNAATVKESDLALVAAVSGGDS